MAFQQQDFTIGVEEEYQIVDPVTRQLYPAALELLPVVRQQLGDRADTEMSLSQLEICTPICYNLRDIRQSLQQARRVLSEVAKHNGKQVIVVGAHPFSHWSEQPVTPTLRYQKLERIYQHLAREQVICGYHVHIGVSDRELALRILNRVRPWLHVFLALSASSPFWLGDDTGFASFRTQIWSRWPLSGPPPQLSSLEGYEALIRAFMDTGFIADATYLYWDARLSARYPTIEVRVADACLTVDEAVMQAGLTRALIATCYEQELQHMPLPDVHFELLRVAHWQAARYGLCGMLIDVQEQRSLPAPELVGKLLHMLRPALERWDEWTEVSTLVRRVLQEGDGATRMRAIYQRGQRYEDVVDFLIAEMLRDIV